jgi:hypothetical protein
VIYATSQAKPKNQAIYPASGIVSSSVDARNGQVKNIKGFIPVAFNVTVAAKATLGQIRTDPNFKSDNGLFAAGAAINLSNVSAESGFQFVGWATGAKATAASLEGSVTIVGIKVRAEAGVSVGIGFKVGAQNEITLPLVSVTVDATPLVKYTAVKAEEAHKALTDRIVEFIQTKADSTTQYFLGAFNPFGR